MRKSGTIIVCLLTLVLISGILGSCGNSSDSSASPTGQPSGILSTTSPSTPDATASPAHPVLPTPVQGQTTDVIFEQVGGVSLDLDLYLPEDPSPHPAVILIHGGGWYKGDKDAFNHLAPEIADWGYAAISINHRLAPDFVFPAQAEDVECAISWVKQNANLYNIDPNRIALMGASSGGHLASLVGLANSFSGSAPPWDATCGSTADDLTIQAIVSLYGPVDLEFFARQGSKWAKDLVARFLGEACQDNSDRCAEASPVTYVSATAPPILLIHGAADDAVFPENSRRLNDALQAAGAHSIYRPIEGADHGFVFDGTPEAKEALELIRDFLDDHL